MRDTPTHIYTKLQSSKAFCSHQSNPHPGPEGRASQIFKPAMNSTKHGDGDNCCEKCSSSDALAQCEYEDFQEHPVDPIHPGIGNSVNTTFDSPGRTQEMMLESPLAAAACTSPPPGSPPPRCCLPRAWAGPPCGAPDRLLPPPCPAGQNEKGLRLPFPWSEQGASVPPAHRVTSTGSRPGVKASGF